MCKLDFMDDDCNIDGYPLDNYEFKAGELVIYHNGDIYKIGRIKQIIAEENSALIYYNRGDTAFKTPLRHIHKLKNAYCIKETTLGGINNGM